MKHESKLQCQNECYYMAHSDLLPDRPTLLIIHGIGDSGASYHEFLSEDTLKNNNILIPDLLGYGKSVGSGDYRFSHQLQGMIQQINHLEETYHLALSNYVLLAHSMGGMHATLLCQSILKNNIKGFLNMEGSVTQYGSFVAAKVVTAVDNHHFDDWFATFLKNIDQESANSPALKYYYDSLILCQPEAFRQNAVEMYELDHALSGKYTNIIGKQYAELTIPRVYGYGESMCSETITFLREEKLQMHQFHFPTHFFMPEGFKEVAGFLQDFMMKAVS